MARGLQLISGNRLEALGKCLADAMRRPRVDPLASDVVVVQSRGMARWVQLELTRHHGVCARTEFPFPKALIREVCRAVVPEVTDPSRFERDALTWRVWEALFARRGDPVFAEPARYAGDDPRRLFQLSARVAGLLDQYLVYRPDLIADWEAGKDDSWQAALWRTVRGGPDAWPESRWLSTATARLRMGPDGALFRLPERVALFGIAVLPPAYLELFAALALHSEVTLYTLQPSQEFWADLVSSREEQRHLRRAGRRSDEAAHLHLERGPRLLMSLGKLGRGFLRQLADHGAGGGEDPFEDPGDDTLLHRVQSDLLHLRDRLAPASEEPRLTLEVTDPSLQVHVCHSPRRELEVLHDQLLDAMNLDPTVAPRDILVLTPDIESYAPLIHAVFGAPEEERLRLPYSIADRVPRAESLLADAFLRLLTLPERRCGRSDIEPLLDVPSLQRRFGLGPEGVVRIRGWLGQLGTRWGLNATQRGALGLPQLPQGTWRHGADRLLLGAAMASGDEPVIGGLSPLDGIEGDGALLAGGMAAFVTSLESLGVLRTLELPLGGWATELNRIFDAFFEVDEAERFDERLVRGALARLHTVARSSEFTLPVRLAAVREQLELWLAEERTAGGFLRGGVTFAALKPMRSIPARIIAVIGLNDTAFPRQSIAPSFDLIAQHPRPGDEAREEDDRHLFLETLLSARDRLHLSHVGQSIRDNAPLPPSVVIGELLDHLADIAEGGAAAVERSVVVRHPLHAFSAEYYGGRADSRLFSYSAESRRAAVTARGGPAEAEAGFLATALDAPAGDPTEAVVELETLLGFLKNASRFFLQERLGVRLPRTVDVVSDRECFDLDGREEFRLKQRWLDRMRDAGSVDALSVRAMADGDLPLGPAGEIAARGIDATLAALLEAIPPEQRRDLPPVPVELQVGPVRLLGQVSGVTSAGLLFVKPARFKASDLLDLWVRQLVLSAQRGCADDGTARMVVEGSDETVEEWRISSPGDPMPILADLLDLLAEGRRRPLPLFPRSAAAFTEPVGSRVKSQPLERALQEWRGSDLSPGESIDPAFALCFGRVLPHPLDDAFAAVARRVMGPMWAHSRKGTP